MAKIAISQFELFCKLSKVLFVSLSSDTGTGIDALLTLLLGHVSKMVSILLSKLVDLFQY